MLQRFFGSLFFLMMSLSNGWAMAYAQTPASICTVDSHDSNWACSTPAAVVAVSPPSSTSVNDLSLPDVASRLGYVVDPDAPTLCKGYFLKEPMPYMTAENFGVEGFGNELVNVSAGKSFLSLTDSSELDGDVVISDRERSITADHGYLFRDPKTEELSKIKFSGDIHLREPNILVLGDSGIILLPSRSWELKNILYQQSLTMDETHPGEVQKIIGLSAWGRAKSAKEIKPKIIDLYSASYTTCPPANSEWKLKASHVRLNKNSGRGYLTNGLLYVKEVPVFYLPYFNFPIDDRRQTGLLPPTYTHSTRSGEEISIPLYINLAPNYDATITPVYLSKRGWLLTNELRYLQEKSSGIVKFNLSLNDRKFGKFKETAPGEFYPTDPADLSAYQAEVDRLANSNTTRLAFAWQNQTSFTPHISANVDYHWMSDDYQNQDFSTNIYDQTETQLLQQGTIQYDDDNFQVKGKLQHYQTLHPINAGAVANQYSRLPELSFSAELPKRPYHLVLTNDADFNYFDVTKNPGQTLLQPTGSRLNLQPAVSLPMENPGMFATPRMQLTMTSYQLHQAGAADSSPGASQNPQQVSRVLPIFDLNAGLKLISNNSLFHNSYTQTLEPQLYYLYVPRLNQNKLPLFDSYDTTQPLAFTYDQMFRDNRFVSSDRIGDTNQVTAALTTRFLQNSSNAERFRASIGETFYFENRKVLLCSDNPANAGIYPTCSNPSKEVLDLSRQSLSPIAGLLSYYFNTNWNIVGSFSWSPISKKIDNETINFHYQDAHFTTFNLGYTFARDGDILQGDNENRDLRQTNASFTYPLAYRWNLLGQWSYNWSHDHIQSYLYGAEYESCCWAVRFINARTFAGFDNDLKSQFDRAYYMQFVLKGVSRLGLNDPSGAISSSIQGYKDNFGRY